jgi:hypothetical protein
MTLSKLLTGSVEPGKERAGRELFTAQFESAFDVRLS